MRQWAKGCVALSALWMLSACEATESENSNANENENQGPVSCAFDFDCSVGETCGAADATGDRFCASAAGDADRVFGQADLSFTGEETYLAVVYSLPTDEQAPSDDPRVFRLGGVNDAESALRIRADRPAAPEYAQSDYWTARLRQAELRRAGVDRLQQAMKRGERTVFKSFSTRQASSCSCTATQICSEGACVDSLELSLGGTTITADVVGTVEGDGVSVSVLLDQNDSAEATAALNVASTFVGAAEDVLYILGQDEHTGPFDRDDSGTISVVFSSAVPTAFGQEVSKIEDTNDALPEG
ncbi:MAG: hypothetical protein AAFY60_03735, partial [Myxococcota bacterium]